MGCGSSTEVKGDPPERIPAASSPQLQQQSEESPKPPLQGSIVKQKGDTGVQRSSSSSAFNQNSLSATLLEEEASSSQSLHTSSDKGPSTATASLSSSRQSLVAASGSLGSKIGRSSILPLGWTPGKSVIIREDPRIAHITGLASTIMKASIVLVTSQEGGRTVVGSPKGLKDGEVLWLPDFCSWLAEQDTAEPMFVEDSLQDERCSDLAWTREQPGIRFIAAVALLGFDTERIGTLCALDTVPHPNVGSSSSMLANLANMTARELDQQRSPTEGATEFVVDGTCIPPVVRQKTNVYCWTSMILKPHVDKWPILFVNDAFRSMTGVPPGCLEGRSLWDYFELVRPIEKDPCEAFQDQLQGNEPAPFDLPPIVFRPPAGCSSSSGRSNQVYRAEMRLYNADFAHTYELEPLSAPDLWFIIFQPDPRATLAEATPQSQEDTPFPGLELGPVIGKGSFGHVCRGALGYLIVAVKIIEAEAVFKVDSEGKPLEASLTKNLRHINIVQMLDYATRLRKTKTSSQSGSQPGSRGSNNHMGSAINQSPAVGSAASTFMGSALSALGGDPADSTVEAWLLLEYCDLGSLLDGIDREWFGPKDPKAAGRKPNMQAIEATAYEIAAAMRYTHKQNILHGDLTAGNVLLASAAVTPNDPRGFIAKVADFGLSREALTSKVETNSYGTVTHMPPELLNDGYLSKHADVYAFGVLLVEMYTGKRAFAGMRHPQIIHTIAVLKKHPQLPPDAPAHFIELAEACMQERPRHRPTFDQIMDVLRPHVQKHSK